MSGRPDSLPPLPDAPAAAVRAAFPQGPLEGDLRDECGTRDDDQLLTDL